MMKETRELMYLIREAMGGNDGQLPEVFRTM